MKVLGLTVLFLAVILSGSNAAKMSEYTMKSYNNGNYLVAWKYDMCTDMFYFNVTVKATGWVGFGVSPDHKGGMQGYDVMVGGVRGSGAVKNESYGADYHTTGTSQPPKDTKADSDWMLDSGIEMNDWTNLMFKRKRKTDDTNAGQDAEIMPGMMYLIWAYHATDDVNENDGSFGQHSARGAVQVTFIDPKYTIVNINDKYMLYWAYDNNTEMFTFTVAVKTTGWVSFGVGTEKSGTMKGYDVMVGGVKAGEGYVGDYLTERFGQPPKDTQEDWKLKSSEERNGCTTVTVTRQRKTGDSKDVEITSKDMVLVWGYLDTDDVEMDGSFAKHTASGTMPYKFDIMYSEDGGDGNGNGGGDKGKDSSAMYYPSIFGIIALVLFQFVM